MRLLDISVRGAGDAVRLVGLVERGSPAEEIEVYFEFPARYRDFVALSADPFAIAMLVPALRRAESLEILPPVSPRLHFELPRVRDIWRAWYPSLPRIDIRTSARAESAPLRAQRAASFFSGGVDSFYTLLKYHGPETLPAPLTHLIYMRGIETKLERSVGVEASQRRAQDVAASLGLECIVGETNIRTQFRAHWERYYFGSGLAATAQALAGGLGYVCIPSSYSYNHQVPHGSTALVDERYSTELLQIVHDGAELSRPEKVARMVAWDRETVLGSLRVCMENAGGAFNCGRCYKCVRTAVALKVLGAWQDARTFPDKSTAHWERVAAADHLFFTEENLAFAREHGADSDVMEALERVVRRARRRQAVRVLVKSTPLRHLLPIARRASRWAGAARA